MHKQSGDLEMFLMRVGDAERDACIGALTDHHIHGRLSVEELDRRQRAALDAVTAADLSVLLADLPVTSTTARRDHLVAANSRERRLQRARTVAIVAVGPVAVVMTSAVMAVGAYDAAGTVGGGVFVGSLITGAVGFASHWALSRFGRG